MSIGISGTFSWAPNRQLQRQTKRGACVRRTFQAIVGIALMSPALWAQAPNPASDHFAPNEVSVQGAQCSFSDRIGVVFRSDWRRRHWIKVAGQPVEFNGETEMSDAGWYQSFVSGDLTVNLRLRRVLPEAVGSDGVRLTGEIVVARSGQSIEYQAAGSCGA